MSVIALGAILNIVGLILTLGFLVVVSSSAGLADQDEVDVATQIAGKNASEAATNPAENSVSSNIERKPENNILEIILNVVTSKLLSGLAALVAILSMAYGVYKWLLKRRSKESGVSIGHVNSDVISTSEPENKKPIVLDYKPYLTKTNEDLKKELDLSIPRTLESKVKEPENQIIPVEEVLSTGKHALILGEPGSGKTYITKYLAKYIIERNIAVENPKIPVRIKARMWGNQFNTIPVAISKELEYIVDNINPDIVTSDINANKFIIIIDGYDEIRGEKKNDLTWEIGRIAGSRKAQIILTSREANYHEELSSKFFVWIIKSLSDEQIDQYAKQVYSFEFFSHHLREQNLLELARLPLYLFMLCEITKDHEGHIPNNKAKIQERFAQYFLEERCRLRNPSFEPKFSIDQKLKFLSGLAKRRSEDVSFGDYARCALDAEITDYSRVLLDEITESGLLKGDVTSVVKFIHPTTAEFFHARSIASLPDSKIVEFIQKRHSQVEYSETILFLVGLLGNQEKQDIVLDYLEENNLPLYIKCLSARQHIDLSDSANYAEIERQYLSQLQRSYNTLLDRYFEPIKRQFVPFSFMRLNRQVSLKNYMLLIRGSLDIANLRLHYEYLPILRESDNNTDPVISKHPSGLLGKTFYEYLDLSHLGLDSAREVAMEDIKDQLKRLVGGQMLPNRPTPLLCEGIVAQTRDAASHARMFQDKSLKPIWKFTTGVYEAREYLEAFESIQDHPFVVVRSRSPGQPPKENHSPIKNFHFIILLLRHFVANSISIQENILPRFEKPWGSDPDPIKKRLEETYSLLPKLYMQLIDLNFPNLREYLWHSKIYPFKYVIRFKYDDPVKSRGPYTDFRFEALGYAMPVASKEDIIAEVIQVESDRDNLWTDEEVDTVHFEYIQNLKALRRYSIEDKFFLTQFHTRVDVLDDEVLTHAVYGLLENDMEVIIEDW